MDEEIFSGSLLFSGVALLNWFTKSSKFNEGFNDNELSWSCSRSLHCVMLLSVFVQQARKFLLFDKELKGKIVLQQSIQYQDSSITVLKIPVILIIKFVTFNMDPKFTEVTLNSFIFAMDIFCTNPARKFGMIDITHEV